LDRDEAVKRIMGGFDDVWMKGIQAKRAAKSGQGSPSEPKEEGIEAGEECEPGEREPEGDTDDGMDEATKAELLELLSQ
jgi:hypothetical protein